MADTTQNEQGSILQQESDTEDAEGYVMADITQNEQASILQLESDTKDAEGYVMADITQNEQDSIWPNKHDSDQESLNTTKDGECNDRADYLSIKEDI